LKDENVKSVLNSFWLCVEYWC